MENIYSIANMVGIGLANTPNRQPAYKIEVNGEDITAKIKPRLMSLSLIDKRGFEADTLDITLDDSDGKLAMPPRNSIIKVWLGWADSGLIYKGMFIAGCPEHAGAPDTITINAISSEFAGAFTLKRERSFDKQTLGKITRTIAAECGWSAIVDAALDNIDIGHLDQQQESNANLLTRLAQENDAICAPKAGKLLLFRAGNASTASGQAIPTMIITRTHGMQGHRGDSHRFSFTHNDEYTGVEATWHNKGTGKRNRATVKGKKTSTDKSEKVSVGAKAGKDEDGIYKIKQIFPDKDTATRAAQAKWMQLQRGIATFTLNLAYGIPDLFPETPIGLRGYKDIIDVQAWLATQVTHSISDSGYTASVDMECANPEDGYDVVHSVA